MPHPSGGVGIISGHWHLITTILDKDCKASVKVNTIYFQKLRIEMAFQHPFNFPPFKGFIYTSQYLPNIMSVPLMEKKDETLWLLWKHYWFDFIFQLWCSENQEMLANLCSISHLQQCFSYTYMNGSKWKEVKQLISVS